ncbi:hypothetical protein BZA05DRAFT_173594 [Tricharina praecox]|uniref:uncharacterized protein n=1 Tax=Tricharina praecox TaxID=43433 RepID=UPI00221EE2BF|nr:uncharacterized protein BZA05DRAFT_173594 [Tricharina praecox]KAI5844294.1 hypothetical protein BZA05DRAFT_173594 [Tricharina praecox]
MSSEIPRHSRALYSPADHSSPPLEPRWSRPPRAASVASSRRSRRSRISKLKSRARKLFRWARKRVRSMTLAQQIIFSLLFITSATIGILTLVFHTQILAAMLPISEKLRSSRVGWLAIFALCFISAFPPMIGYSTSVTLAGFVYGFPKGWFVVASGTLLGSTTAFLCCRYMFRDFARRLVATDKRFAALSLTLKHDGVKLLCMIRLCPLPYSISNGAMSTFPTVTPWAFAFATAIATPKLLLHIWIGARLAVLAAAEQKMDARTKAANYGGIAGGLVLGGITGWVIYTRTLKRARQLEIEERAEQREGLLAHDDEEDEDLRNEAIQDLGILVGDESDDDEEDGGSLIEDDDDLEVGLLGRKRGRSIGLKDQPQDDVTKKGTTTTTAPPSLPPPPPAHTESLV